MAVAQKVTPLPVTNDSEEARLSHNPDGLRLKYQNLIPWLVTLDLLYGALLKLFWA